VTVLLLILCRIAGMLPVFRDVLQDYLGIGDEIWGFLLSTRTGAGLFTVLIGGVLVDRWGPRRVIRLGLIGVAISLGLLALAGPVWAAVAGALALYGMAVRPLGVAINSYLIRLFPDNRRRVLSLNFAGTSVGSMMFPALAEGLLHVSRQSPSVSFGMVFHLPFGLAAAMIFGASFLYTKRTSLGSGQDSDVEGWEWKDLLLPGRLYPIILLMTLHGTADSVLLGWMARVLGSESFAGQPIGPGYVISARAVSYVVSRSILGFVPEDKGRKVLIILPGILGGAALIGGLLSRSYLLTAGGYVLGAFLWSAEYPAMLSIIADEKPGQFGSALSLSQLLSAGAIFLSMNGMGLLVSHLGEPQMWQGLLIPAAAFPVIGISAGFWILFCWKDTNGKERPKH
ncbi:MAG: MFS transporter, partial [Candidatus Brocadiia bacterium]